MTTPLLGFAIPGQLPDWEAMMRLGRLSFARLKREYQGKVANAALNSRRARAPGAIEELSMPGMPITVRILWCDPGHQKPIDPDNQAAAVKIILDGLVQGGLLHNDRRWRPGEGGQIARIIHDFDIHGVVAHSAWADVELLRFER